MSALYMKEKDALFSQTWLYGKWTSFTYTSTGCIEPELLSIADRQAETEEPQLLDQILENPGAIPGQSHGEVLLTLSLRPRGQNKGFSSFNKH